MGFILVLFIILFIALIFVVALCYMIPQVLQTILMRQMRTRVVPKEDNKDVRTDN